ncbi:MULTISPECIES: hypothetical protein [Streptomycetaceae]|uniref:hypothetical protein n=1 Tax=unclassified Streptomyces TaxID=2593676 RepID=UPI00338169F9
MMSFRRAVAAAALTAAAVLASAGAASAYDQTEYHQLGDTPQVVLHAHCNDLTTQFGAVNVNQGPVCIDFGSDDGESQMRSRGAESGDIEVHAACNSAVTQVGLVNVNQGPVCIRF